VVDDINPISFKSARDACEQDRHCARTVTARYGSWCFFPVSITLALAYALGATVITGAPGILLILFTAAFFGLAMSGLAMAIGVRTKSSQAVAGLDLVIAFPLYVCEHSARAIRVPFRTGRKPFPMSTRLVTSSTPSGY